MKCDTIKQIAKYSLRNVSLSIVCGTQNDRSFAIDYCYLFGKVDKIPDMQLNSAMFQEEKDKN